MKEYPWGLQGSSGNTFPGGEKNILQGKNERQESGKQVWSMRKQSGIDGVGRTGLRGAAWLAAMGLSLFLLTGCGQDGESTGNPVPGSAGSISGAEGGFSDDADSRADSSGQAPGETNVGNGVGSGNSEDNGSGNGIGSGSQESESPEDNGSGNGIESESSEDNSPGNEIESGSPEGSTSLEAGDFQQTFDAAEAETAGKVRLETKLEGYTGSGYLAGFESQEDSCSFQVEIPAAGSYDIIVISAGMGGEKTNGIAVDGETVGSFVTASEEFGEAALQRVYLESGVHTVSITTEWGWIGVDAMKIKAAQPLPDSVFQAEGDLVNPNATESTKGLMAYLQDIYGKYILSGQHSDKGVGGPEILALKKVNGDKTPAVLGLDFIEYTPSRVANGSTGISTQLAINFDAMGGINTFCWHWNAPEKYLTDEEPWYRGFYTEATNIDLGAIMRGEDEEGYGLLLRDIDAIAEQIAILQEADVPILFRPLHEASGGWFWWGAAGPESYIELWKLVFQRMTEYHKLNNIIWVWNGQDGDWYPGDEYVDIIGEDIYPGKQVYLSQSGKFSQAVEYADSPKPIALTENGCLFDPELAFRDQAPWLWFCTWSGEFVVKNNLPLLSEEYTEEAMVRKVYEDERVITLDELPDWKQY